MLIFQDSGIKSTYIYLRKLGFKNEGEVGMVGNNGKMDEMQAVIWKPGSKISRRINM